MRIVVTGASGNVGSFVLEQLAALPDVHTTGIARRPPESGELARRAEWIACDLGAYDATPALREAIRGADAIIHLAWLIQPSHNEPLMRATNVDGTARLLTALRQLSDDDETVPALVIASSIGAYSPGPKDEPVDESWPTDGISTSIYSLHKVEVERLLDRFENDVNSRVVRIRPGVVFSKRAASSQARYFLGPLVPMTLIRSALVPVVPAPRRLVVPIVHSSDIAAAFVAAALNPDARGAYNAAADDPLTAGVLADALHARQVPVPEKLLRAAADITWRLRLQPTDAGWVDLGFELPVMSTERAKLELGWAPRWTAEQTLRDWLEGMREQAGGASPVLRRSTSALHQARAALPALFPRLGKRI